MCGIAGIVDLGGQRDIARGRIEAMTRALSHRGPDGEGFHVEAGVALGHRRLSIIDLEGGVQPLYNEDHSVVVTYNGEIYNFQTIAAELKSLGHVFRTHCDTEVIVHAWEQWGEDCVHRFNGMFAFAIWDRNTQCLFLARDRLGIKPLYFTLLANGWLAFGSELKALLVLPDLSRQIEPQAVEDYFALGYVPETKSILRGVQKLEPGHTLQIVRGQPVPKARKYWDVTFARSTSARSDDDIVDELLARLTDAVRLRLIAEVPLGAFLSGGVDSSAVVAAMAGLSAEPVRTCSISFGDRAFNEAEHADKVARHLGTRHSVQQVDTDDFSLLDRLATIYDEPFADSSAIPTYRVCELARRSVTVALSGDGGDENFAGYRRHRWHANEERIRSRLPAALRASIFGPLGRWFPKLDWAPRPFRAKATLQALARDTVAAYLHAVSVTTDEQRSALLSNELRGNLQDYTAHDTYRRYAAQAGDVDALSLIQYLDFKAYLAGDILTKVDRASMAHGLEVRVPLLDYTFVEWVATLPPSVKLRGQEGKYIFKKAAAKLVPREVIYRPKQGFAVPIASWFRGPLRERVRSSLTGPVLADCGLLDMKHVTQLVDQHQSGLRDHSAVLWALLMFEGFLRNVFK